MEEEKKRRIVSPQKGFQQRFCRSNCDTTFGGGVLNPQPVGSKVLTPNGFVNIETLKEGDTVCGIGNKEQIITHSDNEGDKNCIRITLSDGSVSECALDHKWVVFKDDIGEFISTSWELLEAFQVLKEKGDECDIWFYKYNEENGNIIKLQLANLEDIGYKEVICIGVSNEDELYITDDYMITKNCGKTYAAILSVAEPSLDPEFRAVFTRRNLSNLKQAGGIVDDFYHAYGSLVQIKVSESPRISFASGSYVDCIQINNEEPQALMERLKGFQFTYCYMDELTSYNFTTFKILGTRLRSKSRFRCRMLGTTNPKRSHWTRVWLNNYIGTDGFVIPSMDGVVTYYYLNGDKIQDVIFGFSKSEVYQKCRIDIDRKLQKLGGDFSYEDMIKSFVFYSGKMSDNMASIENNKGYIGSVASVGGRRAQQLIEGNFNIDEMEDEDAPIPADAANEVFMNDEQTNGDNWITVDLADKGTDNLVALVWNGLHVIDKLILSRSTPRENAERVQMLAAQHKIGDSHIIFDGTAAAYFNDYIPEAIPYISNKATIGLYGRMAMCLKDECYLRLVEMVKHSRITIDESVGQARYYHENLKQEITIQTEFCEECSVVRFKEVGGGRKRLMNKKEMNAMLGKGRSMDILDACAMRMYPLLEFPYGEELESTRVNYDPNKDEENRLNLKSIYDPSTWA